MQANLDFNLYQLDKMIELNNDESRNEIWLSNDIYELLGLTEYKGYKIYGSPLMKKRTAIIGKMYL